MLTNESIKTRDSRGRERKPQETGRTKNKKVTGTNE